jgi:hypothetical protein
MNERGLFSDLTTRSGVSLRTDDGNLHSVNDKMGAVRFIMLSLTEVNSRLTRYVGQGSAPLYTTRFMSSPKRASDPQGKRATHRIDERHSCVFPLRVSRQLQVCNTSEHGRPEQPASGCNTCDLVANVLHHQDEARRI